MFTNANGSTDYGAFLDNLLDTGLGVARSYLTPAARNTNGTAAATTAKPDWTRIAIIGAIALAVVGLLVVLFRK